MVDDTRPSLQNAGVQGVAQDAYPAYFEFDVGRVVAPGTVTVSLEFSFEASAAMRDVTFTVQWHTASAESAPRPALPGETVSIATLSKDWDVPLSELSAWWVKVLPRGTGVEDFELSSQVHLTAIAHKQTGELPLLTTCPLREARHQLLDDQRTFTEVLAFPGYYFNVGGSTVYALDDLVLDNASAIAAQIDYSSMGTAVPTLHYWIGHQDSRLVGDFEIVSETPTSRIFQLELSGLPRDSPCQAESHWHLAVSFVTAEVAASTEVDVRLQASAI